MAGETTDYTTDPALGGYGTYSNDMEFSLPGDSNISKKGLGSLEQFFNITQRLDSGDSIEIFNSSSTKGLAAMQIPKVLSFTNQSTLYASTLNFRLFSGLSDGDLYWNDGADRQIQITSGGGVNLRYYSVKTEALATTPNPCAPNPLPVFTTGALSQGIMTVIVKLEKGIYDIT